MKKVEQRIFHLSVAIMFVAILFIPANKVLAAADTCTWTGLGGDSNWSTAGNWSDGGGSNVECDSAGIPENGDSLVFPIGASNLTNTNDLVGLNLDSVVVSGSGYTISGLALTLTPTFSTTIQFTGSNNAWDIDTTVSAIASKSIYSSNMGNVVSGDLALSVAGGQINFGTDAGDSLSITGVISGSTDGVVISPDSTVTFNATNTFVSTGTAISEGSEFICQDTDCLGVSDVQIIMYENAQLTLNGTANLVQDIETSISTPSGPAVIYDYGNSTLSGDITVDAPLTIRANAGVTTTLTGDVNFTDIGNFTLAGSGDPTNDAIDLNGGIVSGATTNVVVDGVRAIFRGNNTYSANTQIQSNSVVEARHANALGDTLFDTEIHNGGTLNIASGITIPENISTNGDGATGYSGAIQNDVGAIISGDITLSSDSTIYNNVTLSTLILSGVISGSGELSISGTDSTARIRMSGSSENEYTGTTNVTGTTLELDKDNEVIALPASAIVNSNSTGNGRIETLADEQINNDANITLNDLGANSAELIIGSGQEEEAGALSGNGDVYINGISYSVASSDDSEFSGRIFGPGTFTKEGRGTLTLSGYLADGGSGYPDISVLGGDIVLNPADTSFQFVSINVDAGGTLKGSGIVGDVTINTDGAINAGNSPGCLYPESLTLNNDSIFTIELGGLSACTNYDQIQVASTVNISNAELDMILYGDSTPTVGDSYTILIADSISGTFNGLVNGATTVIDGITYRIDYTATEVKLTVIDTTLADTGRPLVVSGLISLFIISIALSLVYRKKPSDL